MESVWLWCCCGDQKTHCVLRLAWRRNIWTFHLSTIHTVQVCSKWWAVISLLKYSMKVWECNSKKKKVSTRANWHSLKVGHHTPSTSSTQSNPFIHWINLVRHHFSGQGGGAEGVGVRGQWPWANHGLQLSRCAWPTVDSSILSWRKGEQGVASWLLAPLHVCSCSW